MLRVMGKAPVYKADDRSLLLPYYKRFVIEPSLSLIPSRVHPNTITHAGHLLNFLGAALLVGLRPQAGWVFVASLLLVQLYNWADNADGAHARRTKQSSAYGEFLDHGLDSLNTTYIGIMTVYALGSSPLWTVAIMILIPGAGAMTYWEQSETGVFRLGLLNQVESLFVLSSVMAVDAIFGTGVWHQIKIGPLTAWDFFHLWPALTISFGKLRNLQRVHQAGRPIAPALAFLGLHALIFTAAYTHAVSTFVAVAFTVAVNLFWSARMLSLRFQNKPPRVEPMLMMGVFGMALYLAWRASGRSLEPSMGVALAALTCVVYGIFSLREARDGIASIHAPQFEQATRQA